MEFPEPLLTTDELAAVLQVHPRTVKGWARDGAAPCHRVGRYATGTA